MWAYQRTVSDHIVENPKAGCFIDMSLGKTVSTLDAIVRLKKQKEVRKVLVVAPVRVADHTWPEEIKKWEHTQHLTYSKIMGGERARMAGLRRKADIYLINREQIPWLVSVYRNKWDFDMVVIDESSSFKNHQAARFKQIKRVLPKIDRMVLLTGTPTPNGMMDLWAQIYMLDRGERLGRTIGEYRQQFFTSRNMGAFSKYELKKGENKFLGDDIYEKIIHERIGDICISMKAEDYLDLPPAIYDTIDLEMGPKLKREYDAFERDLFIRIDEDEITAANAAVLNMKLLQFASGSLYLPDKSYKEIHRLKIDVLEETLEELNGNPLICFFHFNSDWDRICKHLKKWKPYRLSKGRKQGTRDVNSWNSGEIPFFGVHPQSGGHGLNMQFGGHNSFWYSRSFGLEYWQQANKRLPRPGQRNTVAVRIPVLRGTMDDDVEAALERKGASQDALMAAIKARVRKYNS